MCTYPGVSKSAGNGSKKGILPERKQGRRKAVLHTCKSGVAREFLAGTAQREHADAAQPVRVTMHSCDPPPKMVPSAQRNSDRRFRGRSGPDAGAGVASGLTTWGGTKEPNP